MSTSEYLSCVTMISGISRMRSGDSVGRDSKSGGQQERDASRVWPYIG